MHFLLRAAVALVVGLVAFAVVAVAVTAALEPRIELSLLVGLPVGLFAGLTALFATAVGLWYRDRTAAGPVPLAATRRLWAAIATVVDFVVVSVVGVGVFALVDASAGITLLVLGLPVTLVLAAFVGALAAGRGRPGDPGSRSLSP